MRRDTETPARQAAFEVRGNYRSDYAVYDGDVPCPSQQIFESMTNQHQQLWIFIFSPPAMAIDFAARALPTGARLRSRGVRERERW